MSERFEVGVNLDNQQSFHLDVSTIVTGRTFVASITRWGKSWTTRKIVEQCFGHAGIIIIDPEGEYSSLREKYPFLIIGKDIPLQIETAEFMAEKTLEANISVIIDLSQTEEELSKEYVNAFLRRFFFLETTARKPYLIVVEEAEEFGPERGIATTTCLSIIRNITKKGGKRGIGIIIIAHRPAWVSKGILSQCSNKAVGRIDWPSDLDVLEEYARIPHAAIDKLPTFNKGEFCFTGDWVKEITFVKVGQVQTTHLGYTPEVIPPSPKELSAVIESLRKVIPEVIEKIKPTVIPIAQMEAKIKSELEQKYGERIKVILRTADEKAERKFRTKIDQLQTHIENLSRSQALQPTSPITDVLDHPIVKTRMLELPDKARDLLIKIEREPGQTREQLAAFLTTSTNSVANLVRKVNQVFRATAILGDGKPIRYRSILKRLFITDVAKREIEELKRLQTENREKSERIDSLEATIRKLRGISLQYEHATKELRESDEQLTRVLAENKKLVQEKKQLILMGKTGEAFSSAVSFALENRLSTLKQEILEEVKPTQPSLIDESKINELIQQEIEKRTAALDSTVSLEHKVTQFDFQKQEEHLKADTTTLQGRIIYLIIKEFFNERRNRKQVVTELKNRGWIHDNKEVDAALLELCQKGIFYRKISSGNIFWYWLEPEAKEHIHD